MSTNAKVFLLDFSSIVNPYPLKVLRDEKRKEQINYWNNSF